MVAAEGVIDTVSASFKEQISLMGGDIKVLCGKEESFVIKVLLSISSRSEIEVMDRLYVGSAIEKGLRDIKLHAARVVRW